MKSDLTRIRQSLNSGALKHICCMRWETGYTSKDVNILHAMVARNITGDFKLVCFTDDSSGIRPEVRCLPLPSLDCEIPKDVPGKWPQVPLWAKGLAGVALSIDLDSVIEGNIDCYCEHGILAAALFESDAPSRRVENYHLTRTSRPGRRDAWTLDGEIRGAKSRRPPQVGLVTIHQREEMEKAPLPLHAQGRLDYRSLARVRARPGDREKASLPRIYVLENP